jgi:glycosyltransferase 2 family protein
MPENYLQKEVEIKRWKALIPAVIGLGVIYYFYSEDLKSLGVGDVEFSSRAALAFAGAVGLLVIRDLAYMTRVKILSMGEFSWRSSLNVILLWEFASAITPSVIGGSPIAIYLMKREGMTLGRSVSTVLATSLMDEFFYVLVVPLLIIIIGTDAFIPGGLSNTAEMGLKVMFFTGYGIHCAIMILILLVLFIAPNSTRNAILRIFRLPGLKRWELNVEKVTQEWMLASDSFKGATLGMWLKTLGVTCVSWTARFLILNAVLYIFFNTVQNLEVFARQLSLWIAMLVSPTPGASGIAEFSMPVFMQGVAVVGGATVLIWRILTYYIYLIIGSLLLPGWIVRTGKKIY